MSGQADRPQEILSLPQGGGALAGIGETFTPDPHTGTANLSIPLPLPAGRNGFGPKVSLAYTSGAGNGPFGLGWGLDVPTICRKTSLGVPVYDDSTDIFIHADGEDLVRIGSPAPGITRYQPRTEGSFSYIDHITGTGSDYWQVRSKDGLTSIYGTPGSAGNGPAVLTDPTDAAKIFAWKLRLTTDPFGNRIEYLHERDTMQVDGPHAWDQLYLSRIRYVDYGDRANPSFLIYASFNYATRPDPFSDYRAGFEIRTVRRCTQIEIHSDTGTDELARTMTLRYADQQPGQQAPANGLSLLASVQVTGHDGDATQALPPVTFEYTHFRPADRQFIPVAGGDTPIGVTAGSDHELVDLLGRGLPDVVQLNGVARYWRNTGNGTFASAQTIPDAPAGVQLGQAGVRFADANGDGHLDLMVTTGTTSGYYPWSFTGTWAGTSFRPYPIAPSFSFSDPLVHLVDLTGNGVTDAIRSGSSLECYFSDPDRGWDTTRFIQRQTAPVFPDVSFADPRITWADMTGDGLQDIVYVHDRIVQYWPNLGYGHFGQRITMTSCPSLPFGYNPTRVLVGDIDGDGAADLVYVDADKVTIWINHSGNGWSDPVTIEGTPLLTDAGLLRLIDLFGNGVPGLLFSATDTATPSGRPSSWYLEFTGGVKPFLLSQIDNHIGAITTLTFASSTSFCLKDAQQIATAWRTSLPFPVQVLAKTESIDAISGGRLTTTYAYHHGYWDGVDHEFRGFGRVDQTDTETIDLLEAAPPPDPGLPQLDVPRWCPPVQTRTWYHLGPVGDAINWAEPDYTTEFWPGDPVTLTRPPATAAFLASLPGQARRDAIRTLRGRVLRSEIYGLDGSPRENNPYTVTENALGVSGLPVGSAFPAAPDAWQLQVFFPQTQASRTTQWERGSDPLTRVSFTDTYDSYGQPTTQISAAVPRGRDYTADDPASTRPYLTTYTKTVYAKPYDPQVFITNRTARTTSYEAVNDGTTSLWTLHAAILSETANLGLYAQTRTYYDGEAFTGRPLGQIGSYGAAVRTETLAFDDAIIDAAYASGDTIANPAGRPPYLPPGGNGAPAWTGDYPAEFRSACPPLAGFTWNPGGADPDDHPGYFAEATRQRFDFHTPAGAEGPPGTGAGLLQVARDPLGNDTTITKYDPYNLKPVQVNGPTGLVTSADYDYRILQIRQLTSPSGNISQCTFTPLGLVASVAVMGKPGETVGDTPAVPSLNYGYDLSGFASPGTGSPISVHTIRRVYHITDTAAPAAVLNDTREMTEYSDGSGRKVQVRTQTADLTLGDPIYGDSGLPLDPAQNAGVVGHQRAAGDPINVAVTGWVIYDNKNHVVRSYEPIYATGLEYEVPSGPELGQHQDLYYDPPGRTVKTVNPDGSQTLVIYGVPGTIAAPDVTDPAVMEPTPWETYTYDPNDNAGRTDPVGATDQSHWNTPSSSLTDALGRVIAAVARNGPDGATDWFTTHTSYDIRGNILSITDELGRITYRRVYDYSNGCLRTDSLDAGIRRNVPDASGHTIEQRSTAGSIILASYDPAGRPKQTWAKNPGGAAVTLREHLIYGESADSPLSQAAAAGNNLLGQLYQHYDEAGRLTLTAADFKGNPLEHIREVIADHVLAGPGPFAVDWQPPAGGTITGQAASFLDPQQFQTSASYNALNQVVTSTTPAAVDGTRRGIQLSYDKAGALTTVAVDDDTYVDLMTYNARGQQTMTVYGNGLMRRWTYDADTFRLARTRTERFNQNGLNYQPAGSPLSDWAYSHDLAGNILTIQDRTPGSGVKANPAAATVQDSALAALLASGNALLRLFSYDPLYRLLSATGRECSNIPVPRSWTDDPRCGYNSGAFGSINQANAPSMTTPYTETYTYDPIGDLVTLRHQTTAAAWTRNFGFGGLTPQTWKTAWTSHLNAGSGWANPPTTQLTDLGNMPGAGAAVYTYDLDGNLTGITTSRHLDWDHAGRLCAYRTQAGNAAPSVATTYLYDGAGTRIKKVTVRGPVTESTVYVGAQFEYFTRTQNNSTIMNNTLNVPAGAVRAATIRIGAPLPDDATPSDKYILGDHLDTATITVDGSGSWLNREEYSPYGDTLLGSYAHKRYRYAGRERDEESGLDYSKARYYAPWLARWVSPDPITVHSLQADLNAYRYVRSNPLASADLSGLDDNASTSTEGRIYDPTSERIAGAPEPPSEAPPTNAPDAAGQQTDSGTVSTNSPESQPADAQPQARARQVQAAGPSTWHRVTGAMRIVAGLSEAQAGLDLVGAGAVTSEAGVGIPVAVGGGALALHGLDTARAGIRQLFSGYDTDTLTSQAIQQAGLNRTAANLIDMAIGALGSLAAGIAKSTVLRATDGGERLAAAGSGVAAADQTAFDYATTPSKLDHIFATKHGFDPLVQQFGSREAVVQQFLNALKGSTPASGMFEEQIVVAGQKIMIRGAVVSGVTKIGTAFTP